jgi:hypothetical protein
MLFEKNGRNFRSFQNFGSFIELLKPSLFTEVNSHILVVNEILESRKPSYLEVDNAPAKA